MGYEFKVIKTANEIEDICVANGLASILEYNDIEYKMIDKKSFYSITTDEFDLEELLFDEISHQWNVNSSSNVSQFNSKAEAINQYINENMVHILKYFLGIEDDAETINAIGIGNNYYTLSIRASYAKKSEKISLIRSYISIVGWLKSCSYCKNDSVEFTILLKPKNADIIRKPYNMSYIDKETGEYKILTTARSGGKYMSNVLTNSLMYIETLLKYNLTYRDYSDIIFMKNTLAGNKPLPNKTDYIKTYNLSNELLEDMKKKLTYSNVSIDCKDILAKYILDMDRYKSFSNMIRIYSKNNVKINMKFKEEFLDMYSKSIKEIYNDEIIIKIGKGLNRLARDNKGYEIQAKLYSILNTKHMFAAIRMITSRYLKEYGWNLLNSDELQQLTQIIDSNDNSRICADAILSYATVFINVK